MGRIVVVAVLGALAGGCVGMEYAMKEYGDVKMVTFVDPEGATGRTDPDTGKPIVTTYRIFDKPAESRLMITPGLGASAAMGAVRGLTFGIGGKSSPAAMEAAAIRWLASTGRTCTVASSVLVADPQYEVRYTCTPAAPKPGTG